MMLRREVEVMDDMRRIRREARDPFFSSDVGEVDWIVSSLLVREAKERRLPGRDVALEPADETDGLRSSD